MLSAVLAEAGFSTASYFSPSVFSFRERIQVDGEWISQSDFSQTADEVLAVCRQMKDDQPTFFTVMTAMALLHFARKRVDYAVLEVGLGGRFDATNAVDPVLSIITSIGLEHMDVLGKTTAKIAREKSGIMRAGRPVVCGVKDMAALAVIKNHAGAIGAKLHPADYHAIDGISITASGDFQKSNAAAAATAARLLGVRQSAIKRALSTFQMPARWQTRSHHPRVIIDCCHNPPAARMIQTDLSRDFARKKDSPRVLLFTSMKDKDYALVLKLLAPHFDSMVLCRPPYKRAATCRELMVSAHRAADKSGGNQTISVVSDPDEALIRAKSLAGENGRILVCGSMYLLQYLFGEREFRMTG